MLSSNTIWRKVMTKKTRRRYTAEFKAAAVARLDERRSAASPRLWAWRRRRGRPGIWNSRLPDRRRVSRGGGGERRGCSRRGPATNGARGGKENLRKAPAFFPRG